MIEIAQDAIDSAEEFADPWIVLLYLGITVLAYALSLVAIVLFLRGVKRSGYDVFTASKTFVLNGLLFLVPGIASALLLVWGLAAAGIGADEGWPISDPANALMVLVVVTLASRRSRRQMVLARP